MTLPSRRGARGWRALLGAWLAAALPTAFAAPPTTAETLPPLFPTG